MTKRDERLAEIRKGFADAPNSDCNCTACKAIHYLLALATKSEALAAATGDVVDADSEPCCPPCDPPCIFCGMAAALADYLQEPVDGE